MSDVLERDLVSYDPLSEVTRKERRSLLGLSMLGVALVRVPPVPTKFAALGIEFSQVNQKAFLALFALLVGYYLVAFLVYALTDFVARRRSEHIRYTEYLKQQEATRHLMPKQVRIQTLAPPALPRSSPVYAGFASYQTAKLAAGLRALFEFVLPAAFALFAIVQLMGYGK